VDVGWRRGILEVLAMEGFRERRWQRTSQVKVIRILWCSVVAGINSAVAVLSSPAC